MTTSMGTPMPDELAAGPPPVRHGRSPNRAAAVLLAIVGLLMALAGALALVGQAVSESDTASMTYSGVERLVVEAGSGDLTIRGGSGDTVQVQLRRRWSWRRPAMDGRVEDGVLRLGDGCKGMVLGNCEVSFQIVAPAGVPLVVRNGSGNVTASGMGAGVELRTGSGDVRAESIGGQAVARTSSGNVDVTGVTGNVVVDSGSGDVSASGVNGRRIEVRTSSGNSTIEADEPAPDLIVARSGSGDVVVVVPDVVYQLETRTGSGDVDTSGVAQSPDAPRRIQATTSSGNVTVRRR